MQPEDYLNDRRTLPRVLCYQVELAIKVQGWQLKSKNATVEIYRLGGREIQVEKDQTSFKITIESLIYTARNAFPFLRQQIGTPMVTDYISNGTAWLKELVELLK